MNAVDELFDCQPVITLMKTAVGSIEEQIQFSLTQSNTHCPVQVTYINPHASHGDCFCSRWL